MLEILKYIFSDFWIFIGTIVLIYAVGEVFSDILGEIASVLKKEKREDYEKNQVQGVD